MMNHCTQWDDKYCQFIHNVSSKLTENTGLDLLALVCIVIIVTVELTGDDTHVDKWHLLSPVHLCSLVL